MRPRAGKALGMTSALALNLILMAIVLVVIVGMHHWAIRTQHHDPHFLESFERGRGEDRRTRRAAAAEAERHQGDRRAGQALTA